MKAVLRVLKLSAALAAALAVIILAVVAGNAEDGSLFAAIASRVPVLKTFIQKTYPTSLYGMSAAGTNVLKVARYDMDFIASFSGRGGRYVALYPFAVEAEIKMDQIGRDDATGELLIPEPVYEAALDGDGGAPTVFMDTLDLDWNAMVAPVLAMYREKSVDLAMADRAFSADCRSKAEKCVKDLFGDAKIAWANGKDSAGGAARGETACEYLPVVFRQEGDGERTTFARGASSRDAFDVTTSRFGADRIASFRFGRAGTFAGSFDAFASRLEGEAPPGQNGHIVYRYHDPVSPAEMTFASYADEGYRSAFSYLRGSTAVYYVQATNADNLNAEAISQNIAPALLYLAASACPTAREPAKAAFYDAYWKNYENALGEIRAGRLGNAFSKSIAELDRLEAERNPAAGASPDATVMRELLELRRGDRNLLESLAVTASADKGPGGDESELEGNLSALFWTMRDELGLTDGEADGYRRDLVSTGSALCGDLVENLLDAERNELYLNFFRRRLDAGTPVSAYVDENGKDETWLYFGKAAIEWKEDISQLKVAEKLEANGMKRGGSFVFVFSAPRDKKGFFTRYHAFVLGRDSIAYFENFGRWLSFLDAPAKALLSDITVTDGSITVGKADIAGQEDLAPLFGTFARAFRSPLYNRDRVREILSKDLEKAAIARLERPSFR